MIRRASSRLVLLAVAGFALAGCNQNEVASTKHLQPIPSKTMALMEGKGMRKQDPILVRIYKEESKLEVWKKASNGRYALLKEYEICRWSGTLGPKQREGDKQAPEGFYAVAPGQMNPKSSYYLSFNLGFPNAFDQAYGRTGQHLMVHGDCLSAGCYAMTDPQISEVYALAREAFNGGQRAFQVQAMPFRMTAENMARRRNDPNFAFWKNLKEGADHFEVTKLEPKIDVCNRRYVFNADAGGQRFDASGACPTYQVPVQVASAVAAKQRVDDARFADLVGGGFQLASAYAPQNGRVRRTLDQPIVQVAAAAAEPAAARAVSTAFAAVEAPAAPLMASAAAVPVPAPRPVALAANVRPASEPSSSRFGWLRGSSDEAAPARAAQPIQLAAPVAPSATPGAAVAVAPAAVVIAPQQQVVQASTAPERPFYKRIPGMGWFGGKTSETAAPVQISPATTGTVPAPSPRPRTAYAGN